MKRSSFLLLLAALLCCHTLSHAAGERPFGDGEELVYAVAYRARLIPNTEVGRAVLRLNAENFDGKPAYHITATGRTLPFFRWFYDLNDVYHSWIDSASLLPRRLSVQLQEDTYLFSSEYRYDWVARRVNNTYRNHAWPEDRFKSMPLSPTSFDAVALFYNLRASDPSTYEPGKEKSLSLVLEDTIRTIRYRYVGPETIKVKGLGKFRALRFTCQIATSSGVSFEDGSEFDLWISDDRNRIPLLIETPVRVGSVRAYLKESRNLNYPLDSFIK